MKNERRIIGIYVGGLHGTIVKDYRELPTVNMVGFFDDLRVTASMGRIRYSVLTAIH
jgi:hypothetical protein